MQLAYMPNIVLGRIVLVVVVGLNMYMHTCVCVRARVSTDVDFVPDVANQVTFQELFPYLLLKLRTQHCHYIM